MAVSEMRKKSRQTKTSDEITVEEALFFGFFFAMILEIFILLISVFSPQLNGFLKTLGVFGIVYMAGFSGFFLHVLCSVLLGLRFSFSKHQFVLLAKFLVAIDVGFGAYIVLLLHIVLTISQLLPYSSLSKPIALIMTLPLFGILYVSKKLFGKRASQWFRIKYSSDNGLVQIASKSLESARRWLAQGNYDGAADAFHSTAAEYVNLERWREAAENYLKSADAYAMAKGMEFGAACSYGFAAAAYILIGDIRNTNKAIEKANNIIDTRKMSAEAKQEVTHILIFLTAIIKKDKNEAERLWKIVKKEIERYMEEAVKDAIIVLERNIDSLRTINQH